MAGTPILTLAEAAMKSLVEGMTTDGGYNYNWGTVNEYDMALCTFPSATIELEPEELNIDEPNGAWAGAYYNEDTFRIIVRGKLSDEHTDPNFQADDLLNKALDDLKQVFGIDYHLSGTVNVIMYRGCTRIIERSGDRFIPKRLETRWIVRYLQDRQNPTQRGD